MRRRGLGLMLAIVVALAGPPAFAQDRPEIIRPWVPPADIRSRVLEGLPSREAPRAYEDRSAGRRLPTLERRTQVPPRSPAPSVGRPFQDRSGNSIRRLRNQHRTTQYRSDLTGARQRLERENRSDRRSFDRLQRLRREESRVWR